MYKKNKSSKNKILIGSLLCLSILACTNTPPLVQPSNPVNSVNPSSSILPTPSISSSVSVTPSSTSEPIPTISTSISPTPTTSPSNTSVEEKVILSGRVYDDTGAPLDNIKITVKSLEENNKFFIETNTINGAYVVNNVPIETRLEISAYKSDSWTKKVQYYTAQKNNSLDMSAITVDFGDTQPFGSIDKTNFFFLSDRPEIVSISPENDKSINYANFKFKFTFSEPVNRKSVEDNLLFRYVRNNFSSSTILGDGNNGTENTDGPPLIAGKEQFIISKSREGFSWDDTGKEVTVSINQNLPTSKDNAVNYGISLRNDGSNVKLMDLQGNFAFSQGEFFNNSIRGRNYIFIVDRDIDKPYLESLDLEKVNNKSVIRLNFSKPMNIEGFDNKDLRDLSFYTIYVNDQLINISNPVVRSGERVVEITSDSDTFKLGDRIKVVVNLNLKDAAGNFFSEGVTSGELDNTKEKIYSSR